MNIKNRLKKLENEVIDDSTVCACFPQKNTETWKADLGADSNTSEPELLGEPVPEVCDRCGKQINKDVIILQFVDETTKDRFPNEWNKGKTREK